jgi:DNA-binding transcriptional LysR family regulator
VSRRVSDLEAHLRVQLLVRTSRRLELTDAGRAYVDAARDILASVEEAERTASGEYGAPRGDIAITAPIVFGRLHVLPIVVAFLKAHPDINVRLTLTDRAANFFEDQVDVAVRIGVLPDSGLIAARIGSVSRVVCASPAYLKANAPAPRHPSDLKNHTCVTFEGLASPVNWTFKQGKKQVSVGVRSRLVVNTAEAAIDAAATGLGITRVLSYQIAGAARRRELVTLLSDFEPEPIPVSIVYPGQKVLPPKTRAFIDFASDRLRKRASAT